MPNPRKACILCKKKVFIYLWWEIKIWDSLFGINTKKLFCCKECIKNWFIEIEYEKFYNNIKEVFYTQFKDMSKK